MEQPKHVNNKVGGLMLPDFKNYYKATVLLLQYRCKKRQIEQWNKTGSPKLDQHIYGQLMLEILNKKQKKNWIHTSHYIQNLIQNGPQAQMQNLKL